MKSILLILAISISYFSFSQVKDKDAKVYKTITIKGEYKTKTLYDEEITVTINNATWILENLDVSHYNNGDPIPQVQDSLLWSKLKTGAWCYYEWKEGIHTVKGKLYNYYAIEDKRGLFPADFEMPQWSDWDNLKKWVAEGAAVNWSENPERIKIFMGEDLENSDYNEGYPIINCTKNKSYYREGNGHFGSVPSVGFWWLPEDKTDMTVYFSRCAGTDGAYFGDFPKENWKNYGFFVRCFKKK